VVLRTPPRLDAGALRALLKGAEVTILTVVDDEWARVRGDGSLEGWVPTRYLELLE
jgi:hypothetical protein